MVDDVHVRMAEATLAHVDRPPPPRAAWRYVVTRRVESRVGSSRRTTERTSVLPTEDDVDAAEGPYFDELAVGQVFDRAPSFTLTTGHAVVHQSIVGDRLRLPLDAELSRRTAGVAIAHPALVWNVAIGQSTIVTHHVVANLFYRGLVFRRVPALGDTLRTRTEVVALRQNAVRPGRRPTGLAALRITTIDQEDRPVLDFWRCAMLPLRDQAAATGHADDLSSVGDPVRDEDLTATRDWAVDAIARPVEACRTVRVVGGDVVTGAPELARLTLNIAEVHHDVVAAGGRRLVYGGHTIGLALAQATRAFPDMVTVLGWHSCHHTGAVHEGDTLTSTVEVERVAEPASGGTLVHLRSLVRAVHEPADEPRDVLDWRFVAVLA